MNRRILNALALVFLGLITGLVVSRLFDSTGTPWLPLAVAFLGGIAVGIFVMGARQTQQLLRGKSVSGSALTDGSPYAEPVPATSQLASPETVAASTEPETLWSGSRFALVRQSNRYSAQARNIGKYESVKFSVVLPQEWWQRDNSGAPTRVETRAVLKSFARVETFAWVMFGLSILVYAFTRFFKLDEFPISFLGDEAVVVTLARDLLRNGFHDPKLGWFPLYFNFFFVVNPLDSVYLQALAVQFFGVSITVARAASALLTVFGVAAVALTLKSFFNLKYWWTAVLFLAITPTWFLHSRTVFDTVSATAFYAIFIFCYCLYRFRSPRYSFIVVLAAAAMFYSYPAAQLVLALTVVLLAISDLKYHLQNIKWWLFAAPLIVIVLLPYVGFAREHPEESWYHLRSVDSYVVKDIPLSEKLTGFISRYAQGISPLYWFTPNDVDLLRHRMKDYSNLPLIELPLLLVGMGVCLRRFRESKYRILLIALVSAPFAAALVDVLILRILSFVIPATLLSVLGMEYLLNRFARRLNPQIVGALLLVVLSFGGIWMTRDALVNGPTWYKIYDLYGMQWGAKELFQVLTQLRQASPKSPIVLTSSWANGTEQFINFFLPNDKGIRTRTIDAWIENQEPLSRNTIFVMTPAELNTARESKKFKPPELVWLIKYPDGSPGFEIVRMAYVDNIQEVFQKEKEERSKPVADPVEIAGETVTLTHSQFDNGKPQDMFDGDDFTLARGREANPLLLDLAFPSSHSFSSLRASFGQMRFTLTVSLYPPGSDQPVVYTQTSNDDAPIPEMTINFDNGPATIQRVKIEVEHLGSPGEAKIHVREIQLK